MRPLPLSLSLFAPVVAILVLSEAHIHKGHAYLDVHIKVTPSHIMCKREAKCTIPYALSMLVSPNQFDLQSSMMQEGVLSYSNGRFNDSTVVRLSRSIKHHEGKLYLGLRLFDIPEGSQDYTIVDVTRAIDEEERTKVEMITDSFRLMVKVSKEHEITKGRSVKSCLISDQSTSPLRALRDKPVMCECSLNTCACCAFLAVDKIRLHNDVCVNLTYLPEDIGIKLSLSIDNRVVFSDELSVRNPPPVCFGVPYLREYASLCIRLMHMDFRKQHLIGCVELDVELYHVRITRANLGCFNLPVDA
ncbi:hypothetical protein Tcan_15469 [Toxocara canis]|uniref:DUF4773 domain-containing protein n=1 Tax=Toxocara canis TaxID=6265 RepID=A0A0B2V6Q1_TOXCA|nr:hypothetical protein Tcan_15469 [Toxocara canis]